MRFFVVAASAAAVASTLMPGSSASPFGPGGPDGPGGPSTIPPREDPPTNPPTPPPTFSEAAGPDAGAIPGWIAMYECPSKNERWVKWTETETQTGVTSQMACMTRCHEFESNQGVPRCVFAFWDAPSRRCKLYTRPNGFAEQGMKACSDSTLSRKKVFVIRELQVVVTASDKFVQASKGVVVENNNKRKSDKDYNGDIGSIDNLQSFATSSEHTVCAKDTVEDYLGCLLPTYLCSDGGVTARYQREQCYKQKVTSSQYWRDERDSDLLPGKSRSALFYNFFDKAYDATLANLKVEDITKTLKCDYCWCPPPGTPEKCIFSAEKNSAETYIYVPETMTFRLLRWGVAANGRAQTQSTYRVKHEPKDLEAIAPGGCGNIPSLANLLITAATVAIGAGFPIISSILSVGFAIACVAVDNLSVDGSDLPLAIAPPPPASAAADNTTLLLPAPGDDCSTCNPAGLSPLLIQGGLALFDNVASVCSRRCDDPEQRRAQVQEAAALMTDYCGWDDADVAALPWSSEFGRSGVLNDAYALCADAKPALARLWAETMAKPDVLKEIQARAFEDALNPQERGDDGTNSVDMPTAVGAGAGAGLGVLAVGAALAAVARRRQAPAASAAVGGSGFGAVGGLVSDNPMAAAAVKL